VTHPTQSQDDELQGELEKGSPLMERVGLVGGPLLAAAAWMAGPSLGLAPDARLVFALLALMATWWVTLAVEPALTSLLPFVLLPVLGIGTPAEIAAPYANDVIFLFGGGALLALALERTTVSSRFASWLVRLAGTSPLRVLAAVMLATAVMSAFVSNLATTATMLPLATALAMRTRRDATDEAGQAAAKRFATSLLLGIAFASSIGGAVTIIGSPPNPIAVEWLRKNGVEMDFVRWLRFSLPTAAVFLPVAIAVLGVWIFPARGIRVPPAHEQRHAPMGRDAWVALGVFLLAVTAWVTQPLYAGALPAAKDGTIAVAAAAILFLVPSRGRPGHAILDGTAFAKVPWRVLVLFGGGLCLADAMQRSGLSTSLGQLLQHAGTLPSLGVLAVLVTVLVFASEVGSNTTLVAMAVPIVGALAPGLGVQPETLVIPATFAASWAFALPVGTPPNALVYATGRVASRDMLRAGLVLDVIAIVVIVAMARLLL
jgi:sodium-dependent dicarboxylate transporter 2/3/5